MTFTTRLALFFCIAIGGVIAWHWSVAADSSREVTRLAVQQFQNSDIVATNLQQASLAQNWWPFLWPVLVLVIGVVMFWDDAERWWHQSEPEA